MTNKVELNKFYKKFPHIEVTDKNKFGDVIEDLIINFNIIKKPYDEFLLLFNNNEWSSDVEKKRIIDLFLQSQVLSMIVNNEYQNSFLKATPKTEKQRLIDESTINSNNAKNTKLLEYLKVLNARYTSNYNELKKEEETELTQEQEKYKHQPIGVFGRIASIIN